MWGKHNFDYAFLIQANFIPESKACYERKNKNPGCWYPGGSGHLAVARVAQELGFTDFAAHVTSVQKHNKIEAMRKEGSHVLMIGGGLNDAAALAAADVSMSPYTALDITPNAANIVFRGDRLAPVLEALTLCKRADALVKQNFVLSFCYNIIAVPLAMAGHVTPLIAAIAMVGWFILVVANAQRMNRG